MSNYLEVAERLELEVDTAAFGGELSWRQEDDIRTAVKALRELAAIEEVGDIDMMMTCWQERWNEES